jgi:hypothetical protein
MITTRCCGEMRWKGFRPQLEFWVGGEPSLCLDVMLKYAATLRAACGRGRTGPPQNHVGPLRGLCVVAAVRTV